ncbi:DNA polymerase IV [Saccharophagus degradans]|uniref:DNA polymerase IV n=1 Tax=Saccharophagus degradans TaxID=86304 RepID=A0AAW7XA84_9GAMM|nr:DNA polymerase IV [Saccharophagus degradans]MDO6424800.1 DNA polymerase IV [Saccharophagus degradans]MDO6609684.1 DNA polymerase IV [Saccharophagus degradans]
MSRKIIHCDADCFFAAIEMRDDPSLMGRPIAVGGRSDRRGVISTCNYEAREYGVRSAMASAHALRLCPDLIILPHNMEKYRLASMQMREIFYDYTDLVEPLSLDEAFLDVSGCSKHHGSATLIAKEIKQRIHKDVGITVSAGAANCKFLAKIASDINKPNGLTVIPPEKTEEFVLTLPVSKIFGVGKVTQQKMAKLGLYTCRDLKNKSQIELSEHFGSFGQRLFELCRGIDKREVKPSRSRKSLSVEHTFPNDLKNIEQCIESLPPLFVELKSRLNKLSDRYKVVKAFTKIKFNDFSTTTIERVGTSARISDYTQLLKEGFERGKKPVRLIGMGVRILDLNDEEGALQLDLFKHPADQ